MKNYTYEKFNIQIGRRIMNLRLHKHYTREYLAELAEISTKFLYEIEMGKKGCSSYVLYMLAQALDVSMSSLIQDNIKTENDDINWVYQMLESTQKDKIISILKILFKMICELES